ncbi:MAG: N-acetylneuraminate synthase [Muribaculaceae bacterium]|nr:N-acetylneuraminate synthase [Muribaculaceae bacterium]
MSEKRKVTIIAEAGVNHNGDFRRAVEMIDVAADAGVDYVKFQTAVPELLVAANAPKADYQKDTTGAAGGQLDMLRNILLPLDDFARLAEHCHKRGVGFLSTPFDLVSIDVLDALKMDFWKIPSGEITNLPYLKKIASKGGSVVLSTGMSSLAEIADAVDVLTAGGIPLADITLLHCNTEYPTPFADVNLRAMLSLKSFGVGAVGYSDHTLGISVPVAAVALGARVVEKHFTLDKNLPGPDHRASLDPSELRAMVKAICEIEQALGSDVKTVTPSEAKNITAARKSIVAACGIAAGELLTADNLAVKRPGGGISPMLWDKVVGTAAIRDFSPDEMIEGNFY